MSRHTVEKIGGTSMSRCDELIDTLILGGARADAPYGRVFVVSAFAGMTDRLLEHKKSGEAGVYALFSDADGGQAWSDALDRVADAMRGENARLLSDAADRELADAFVRERIEGARNCLIDLRRLCSYGHFRLEAHMHLIRELLAGLGEAHSARVLALLLARRGINARLVDLTGWRDESQPDLDGRIDGAFADVDFAREMPIVTGYAQCREGLMSRFDRGYSEVTFSRIAARTGAAEAVIHKEFHLSSADPRIVGEDAVRKIGRTNYDVADQLSNLGMEAIHPSAAKTLRQADIPLRVANAFEPEDPGTLITPDASGEPRVEMVTGLEVTAIEVFEQDMVGTKGYDATILDALTRHKVRIVSKVSNANTITHYVDASLKSVRRVERELSEAYPAAEVRLRRVALVAAIGARLGGLGVARRALDALEASGLDPLAVQETGRGVDVQLILADADRDAAIRALHAALIPADRTEDRVKLVEAA